MISTQEVLEKSSLDLVRKMYSINCSILYHGLKKITMNYYYCKVCDKEFKHSICEECIKKCHKGHISSQLIIGNEGNKVVCYCGLKGHYLKNEEKLIVDSSIQCKFIELNQITNTYEYYINPNGRQLCTFCHNFCRQHSVDEKEFMIPFEKIILSQDSFDNNNKKNINLLCDCTSLPFSKHRSKYHLTMFINNLNHTCNDYFHNVHPLNLLNLFFKTKSLYEYLYKEFLDEREQCLQNTFSFDFKHFSSSALLSAYTNYAYLLLECPQYYYLSTKLSEAYSIDITRSIINENISIAHKIKITPALYDFYHKYLLGFRLAYLNTSFTKAVLYSLYDFINMSPFQRILNYYILKQKDHEENVIIDLLLSFLDIIIKQKPSFSDVSEFLIELLSIFNLYASLYLFSNDQIMKYCKSITNCFYHIFEPKEYDTSTEDTTRIHKLKVMSYIFKTIFYFAYYYNDIQLIQFIMLKDTNEFTFFHSFNELSRSVMKILIHLLNYIREQLTFVNKLINENKEIMESNNQYKSKLIKMISLSECMFSLSIRNEDMYLIGLRRSIDSNLENMTLLINKATITLTEPFYLLLTKEINCIEQAYYDNFQTAQVNIEALIVLISESLNKFFGEMEVFLVPLPINNENDFTYSFEYEQGDEHYIKNNETQLHSTIDNDSTLKANTINSAIIAHSIPYKVIISATTFIFTITKIFTFSKDKSVYSIDLCDKIIKVLHVYITDSVDNSIIGLASPLLNNLSEMPITYYDKVFDYIIQVFKILIINKSELPYSLSIIKSIYQIYLKTTNKSSYNILNSVNHSHNCLVRFLKILILGFSLKIGDKSNYIQYVQSIIGDILTKDIILKYKEYLLLISKDFDNNAEYYYEKRDYDNETIFIQLYNEEIQSCGESFRYGITFKIFVHFICLLNFSFDGNALDQIPPFVIEFLNAENIISILHIKTLHIALRLELLKFFRMAYIDMQINIDKMQCYRYEFQQDLEVKISQMGESLLPVDQLKIFVFLETLLKVGNIEFSSQESKNEYDILLYEISNINEIISHSPIVEEKIYQAYFETGILFPIKIYLNKIFSMIMSINGKEFLKIYKFAFHVLKLKRYVLQKGIFKQKENTEIQFDRSLFKSDKLKQAGLYEVENDLKKITAMTFQPLNYLTIYNIISNHIMSLIGQPTSKDLVMYFSAFEEYEENTKQNFKSLVEKKGINLTQGKYHKMWIAYEYYIDQKNKFNQSTLCPILNENHAESDTTFRTVILKFLFCIATQKLGRYSNLSLEFILLFLKAETSQTQKSVWDLVQKNNKEMHIPIHHPNHNNNNNSHSHNEHNISQSSHYNKHLNTIDFTYLADLCFKAILSTILAQYNPTSNLISNDYYNACHIIKLFKFLCEEHNKNFQSIFLQKILFSINGIQKISYYDMMLFILEKIITLSSWDKARTEDEVQDYFYGLFSCIIEMLIEVVQGTDQQNFLHLVKGKSMKKVKFYDTFFGNKEDMYENGKALKTFLSNIKGLMFNDISDAETIFCIRKNLMEFVLAFIEEYNCPNDIKQMIMLTYHPASIIRSISIVMKKYYITSIEQRNQSNSIFINDFKSNSNRNNNIGRHSNIMTIEKSINNNNKNHEGDQGNNNNIKKKDKKLKHLKFNDVLYREFTHLYFSDDEFSKTKAFDLCSAFYNYFNLTFLQYKNEESIDFMNKINSINKEALEDFNIRSKNIPLRSFENMPITDDLEFEAYYVIKFFSEISKSVLVKVHPKNPPVYVVYTMLPYLKYLSSDSKNEFIKSVNRKSRNTKLYDLMEQSEFFRLEIDYNWKHLRNNKLFKMCTEINYQLFGYIIFVISIGINIGLLASIEEGGISYSKSNSKAIITLISLIVLGIVVIIVILWFLTKMSLYYKIEKAKFRERYMDKKDPHYNKFSIFDKIYIRYQAIMKKGELTPLFCYCVFTILALSDRKLLFFYSFSLLSVVSLSKTLSNIAMSIFFKGRQLLWTTLFTFVLLYLYAGWGFYYQRDRFYDPIEREKPDYMCQSLLYCLLTQINNGLRWHPGIGKVALPESPFLHPSDFIHKYIHDFIFFWLLEAMMLHVVFGIILDSFRELRKKQFGIEKDISNRCFICNLEKDECEKNNKSFKEHCEKEHNIWDYAYYMITLRMKDPQDLNAVNSTCQELIFEKRIGWLPDNDIHSEEDGDKESNNDNLNDFNTEKSNNVIDND